MEPPPPPRGGMFSNLFRKPPPPLPSIPHAPNAPVPATTTTTTTPSMSTEQDRREQRLAKNRESARQSRRRKKEKLELLSERMCELNEELERERQATATTLAALDDPAPEERQALRAYRFARLHRLLSPPHARFWLWLQGQGQNSVSSKASSSSSSSSSSTSASKAGERLMQQQQEQGGPQGWDAEEGHKLWPLLCFELQLKGEQEERALLLGETSKREEMKEEVEALAGIMESADTLERDLDRTADRVQEKMAAVRRVLTPAQVKVLER